MRQIFTSQRLETVEGVAKLLSDAGIEVHISNARSYRGQRGSQFRYTEPVPKGLQPAIWIRHPEDQPRARQILRDAGLLETTRPGSGPSLSFSRPQEEPAKRSPWAWRIRLILLAVIALAAFVTVMRHRQARPAAPPPPVQSVPAAPAQPPQAPAESEQDDVRVQVKPASGG